MTTILKIVVLYIALFTVTVKQKFLPKVYFKTFNDYTLNFRFHYFVKGLLQEEITKDSGGDRDVVYLSLAGLKQVII